MSKFVIASILIMSSLTIIKPFTPNTPHKNKRFPICNKTNCPKSRGICTRDNVCVCLKDFTTHENFDKFGNHQCNYFLSNQAHVFILEFLFGFGAGHYYLGNYLWGTIKLIFSVTTAIAVAILPCLHENKLENKKIDMTVSVMGLIYVLWQALDGILIGANIYKDKYGMPMNSMWEK